jgi:hypothetical protein
MLRDYLKMESISAQEVLIGKLNLAAALVHERLFDEAAPMLKNLRDETLKSSPGLFYGNTLELSAQLAIEMKEWKQAQSFLQLAAEQLKNTSDSLLFVKKSQAILDYLRGTTHGMRALFDVRREAEDRSHWETVRDLDLYIGRFLGDHQRLRHVYYGTPYPAFRERICREFGEELVVGDHFVLSFSPTSERKPIDLFAGGPSTCGSVCWRLSAAFLSDFYRPFRTGELFGTVYPGEYFNPDSGPLRVRQAIWMFRRWLSKPCPTLAVDRGPDGYRLAGRRCSIRVPRKLPSTERFHLVVERLQAVFGSQEFSSPEASRVLHLSPRTARRTLAKVRAWGAISSVGAGKATRYSIKG